MSRAFTDGGLTHIRYGHASRPRDLDVCCPRCGGRAHTSKRSEQGSSPIVADIDGTWNSADWEVTCLLCPYRARDLAYESLPPLYWQVAVRNKQVWAWNRDHLLFLLKYLKGDEVNGDLYVWFGAYVPGAWKRDRARIARALEALLEAQ